MNRLCHRLTFITIVYILLAGYSCYYGQKPVAAKTPQTRSSVPGDSAKPHLDMSIRNVDFGNFSYPWPKDMIAPQNPQKTFTLRNGRLPATRNSRGFIQEMGVQLVSTIYGDTTADRIEEAIVVLSIVTGGSSLPNFIYIYTWRHNKTILLWSFVTGDRADGGLRDIRIENGKVLLEIYSPVDKMGDCCPKYFKRVWLAWAGNRFTQKEQKELVPNVEGHGSPIITKPRRNL
jgi:hypothetical protein